MLLTEFPPGTSMRLQLAGSNNRRSTVWSITSARRSADIYVTPRMSGGKLKISLHQSGSWHVGLVNEAAHGLEAGESRHWEVWKRGGELAAGVVRAWYLLIPEDELRVLDADPKAYQLPDVGQDHALSLEVLFASNEGTQMTFDSSHVVGRWRLHEHDESCLVVARRIPWSDEQRSWADRARKATAELGSAKGAQREPDHRYFLHGHNSEGVRFGLELAAI